MTGTEVRDNAQVKGYMSLKIKIVSAIEDIENPDTSPEERKQKLTTLAQAIMSHNGDEDILRQEYIT